MRPAKAIIDRPIVQHLRASLHETAVPLKEEAYPFRFSMLLHFCFYFKQHTGATPQEFRRRGRE